MPRLFETTVDFTTALHSFAQEFEAKNPQVTLGDVAFYNRRLQRIRSILMWLMRQGWHPQDTNDILLRQQFREFADRYHEHVWKEAIERNLERNDT